MPLATVQQRKRKRDTQPAKNCTDHKESKFLNMDPKQVMMMMMM